MSTENIIDLASYRRDGGETGPIVADFWELATTGMTAQGRIVVGRSTKAEIALLLGIEDSEIELEDAGVAGLTWFEHGNVTWTLDADLTFAGLHFGDAADNAISIGVQEAVALRTRYDEPIPTPPGVDLWVNDDVPLRLKGRRLDQFASLTRFLGTMHDERPSGTSVRGKEKWVRFDYEGAFGTLRAGFILKVFNLEAVEHFNVDYCLHGIGFVLPHEVRSRVTLPSDDGGER